MQLVDGQKSSYKLEPLLPLVNTHKERLDDYFSHCNLSSALTTTCHPFYLLFMSGGVDGKVTYLHSLLTFRFVSILRNCSNQF